MVVCTIKCLWTGAKSTTGAVISKGELKANCDCDYVSGAVVGLVANVTKVTTLCTLLAPSHLEINY